MRTAVAIAVLVAASCGLSAPPARSQTTCSELHSMVFKREAELMASNSAITSHIIAAAGNPTAFKKVCAAAEAVIKEAAELKAWVNRKKSLCVGEPPPDTSLADTIVKGRRDYLKELCR
jgi:hypothetical protein